MSVAKLSITFCRLIGWLGQKYLGLQAGVIGPAGELGALEAGH